MTESRSPDIVRRFFAAMQTGAAAESDMMALFAPDAVYVEPFSGSPRIHRGAADIRRAMKEGWKRPLPDMHLTVDQIEVSGPRIAVEWTCYSPAIPGGAGRGTNVFEVVDGLITRLETSLRSGD